MLMLLPSICTLLLLCVAIWTDLRFFRIANWLNLSIFLLFIVQIILHPVGFPTWLSSLEAFLLVFIGFGLFWYFKSENFGGGDWKMLSALAPWCGLLGLLKFFLVMSLFGGLEVFVILAIRKFLSNSFVSRYFPMLFEETGIPYGLAIAAGGFYIIFSEISVS